MYLVYYFLKQLLLDKYVFTAEPKIHVAKVSVSGLMPEPVDQTEGKIMVSTLDLLQSSFVYNLNVYCEKRIDRLTGNIKQIFTGHAIDVALAVC